ncbi:MAG: NERD domain-containing protein [Bacteroidales bacterium]|jgi:hypothetical protein|nr:NERD domain-containing protein [Bacteroidales bacterium]
MSGLKSDNMGLAKYLKLGKINVNSKDRCIEIDGETTIIPYEKITNSDWGAIYEKYVGQIFEDNGYEVIYNGLNLGFIDKGIDLIAKNASNIILIQCKYFKGFITKNKIEWILYKASKELLKNYYASGKKVTFMLVVNSIDNNFSKQKPKGFNPNYESPNAKIEYPLLQYFLDHNYTQDKIKLACKEITMER